MGSSPRVRGTWGICVRYLDYLGLIPAGAGNIYRIHPIELLSGAHPRGCGEHALSAFPRWSGLGSSPRVRGTYQCESHGGWLHGLIPAGAGNMGFSCVMRPVRWAHPRGCGEHRTRLTPARAAWGSSPRVRGTCGRACGYRYDSGLIPAGAGNMLRPASQYHQQGAHPRGCGEHLLGWRRLLCVVGSSPRVRGTFSVKAA